MSVKVMTAVFERYPNGGGEMLLALALADHASDDGSRVYPSIKTLAEKTRQSERSVQYQLRAMESTGWLILVNSGNGGRNQSREYVISSDWLKGAEIAPPAKPPKGANTAPFPAVKRVQSATQKGATDDVKGAIHDAKGCNGLHPHITINESLEPLKNRESAQRATPAAVVCMAMKAAGMAGVNPSHPELIALLVEGVQPAVFADAARKALEGGKGFAYALAVVRGWQNDAKRKPANKPLLSKNTKDAHHAHAVEEPI